MPYLRNKNTGQVVFVPDAGGQAVAPNPLKVQEAQASIGNSQAQAQGKALDNRLSSATMGDSIAKAAADRQAAQFAAQEAQAKAAQATRDAQFAQGHNGLSRDKWNELNAQLQAVRNLNPQIAKLRDLYRQSFKGKGIGSIAEYLPATVRPVNGVFDNTGMSLIADLAKAKGLTSQQFNTPAEQRMFFEPMIPKASDPDEVMVSKIDALQRMVNNGVQGYAGQMGLKVNATPPEHYQGNGDVDAILKKYGM